MLTAPEVDGIKEAVAVVSGPRLPEPEVNVIEVVPVKVPVVVVILPAPPAVRLTVVALMLEPVVIPAAELTFRLLNVEPPDERVMVAVFELTTVTAPVVFSVRFVVLTVNGPEKAPEPDESEIVGEVTVELTLSETMPAPLLVILRLVPAVRLLVMAIPPALVIVENAAVPVADSPTPIDKIRLVVTLTLPIFPFPVTISVVAAVGLELEMNVLPNVGCKFRLVALVTIGFALAPIPPAEINVRDATAASPKAVPPMLPESIDIVPPAPVLILTALGAVAPPMTPPIITLPPVALVEVRETVPDESIVEAV